MQILVTELTGAEKKLMVNGLYADCIYLRKKCASSLLVRVLCFKNSTMCGSLACDGLSTNLHSNEHYIVPFVILKFSFF